MMPSDPTSAHLDWHQSRRAGGTPVVTVLAGPEGLAVRRWARWLGGRSAVTVRAADPDAAAAAWSDAAFRASPGHDLARAWLARVGGEDRLASIRAANPLTRFDLEQLWRSLPVTPDGPAARVAFAILTGDDLADSVGGTPLLMMRGLWELLPAAARPALLVAPPADGRPGWLAETVAFLTDVAAVMPDLPVAVAATRSECEALAADPRSRWAAVVRDGWVAVEGISTAELSARLDTAGVRPPPAAGTIRRLASTGLDAEAAGGFVAAARAVRDPAADEETFRSVHERFLFDQLEALPETTGLFRPNRPLPFVHGPRAAEADLLADRLKLVIEVDGGYYHLNPDAYRRDRAKDVLYQRHGYFVLRFLAEDVVDDLEAILTAILAAVADRRPAAV